MSEVGIELVKVGTSRGIPSTLGTDRPGAKHLAVGGQGASEKPQMKRWNSRANLRKQATQLCVSRLALDNLLSHDILSTRRNVAPGRDGEGGIASTNFLRQAEKQVLKEFDELVKTKSTFMFLSAMVSCIFVIILEYSAWDPSTHTSVSNWETFILKSLLSLSTVVMIIQLIDYYKLQLRIKRQVWSGYGVSIWDVLGHSRLTWRFLVEALIIAMHSPPGDFVNDKASLFVFLRVYWAIRLLRDWSPLYRQRNEIKEASVDLSGFALQKFNWLFGLKWLFYEHTFITTLILTLGGGAMLAFCIFVTERERNNYREETGAGYTYDYQNSAYFTVTTMTTVGYGDMQPLSDWGRGVSMTAAVIGLVLTSFLIATIGRKLELEPRERFALSFLKLRELKESERECAASLIQYFLRYGLKARRRARILAKTRATSEKMNRKRAGTLMKEGVATESSDDRGSSSGRPKGYLSDQDPKFVQSMVTLIKRLRKSRSQRAGVELQISDSQSLNPRIDSLADAVDGAKSAIDELAEKHKEREAELEQKLDDLQSTINRLVWALQSQQPMDGATRPQLQVQLPSRSKRSNGPTPTVGEKLDSSPEVDYFSTPPKTESPPAPTKPVTSINAPPDEPRAEMMVADTDEVQRKMDASEEEPAHQDDELPSADDFLASISGPSSNTAHDSAEHDNKLSPSPPISPASSAPEVDPEAFSAAAVDPSGSMMSPVAFVTTAAVKLRQAGEKPAIMVTRPSEPQLLSSGLSPRSPDQRDLTPFAENRGRAQCPKCDSTACKRVQSSKRDTKHQRWTCQNCGRFFKTVYKEEDEG